MDYKHTTVLKTELVEGINAENAKVGVDCTFGSGGHSLEIINKMKSGDLFVFDLDNSALENLNNEQFKNSDVKITKINDNFQNIKNYVKNTDFIIADLGFSTNQLENALTFKQDGELDLRLDPNLTVKAKDLVNALFEKELIKIFEKYSDEQLAKPIAKAIVLSRKNKLIETKFELREIIRNVVSKLNINHKSRNFNPEARIFQALRITVNNEYGALEKMLNDGFEILNPRGRIGIISFHSGEDRIVKSFMKSMIRANKARWTLEKARPSEKEIMENSKAHSAILRIIEKF